MAEDWKNIPLNYEEFTGFVYLITSPEGMKYVGQKMFWAHPKDTRKGARKGSRRWVETNWRKYWGSSERLLEDRERLPSGWSREILRVCRSKAELNYYELKEQLERDALIKEEFYNGIINVRIGRNTLPKDMLIPRETSRRRRRREG